MTDTPCSSNPDAWFATHAAQRREAARLCYVEACPVLDACRALGSGERFGVWGGLDMETAYRRAHDNAAAQRELRPCGTLAAYSRHQRAGEPPCDRCKAAHAIARRQAREAAQHG